MRVLWVLLEGLGRPMGRGCWIEPMMLGREAEENRPSEPGRREDSLPEASSAFPDGANAR
jgi:hypothetical protein